MCRSLKRQIILLEHSIKPTMEGRLGKRRRQDVVEKQRVKLLPWRRFISEQKESRFLLTFILITLNRVRPSDCSHTSQYDRIIDGSSHLNDGTSRNELQCRVSRPEQLAAGG